MENYKDSISFKLELKNLLLQLTDVYKVSASPHLEKVQELAKQVVNQKKDFLFIVTELFALDEKNELIEVILLNFVLKLLRGFLFIFFSYITVCRFFRPNSTRQYRLHENTQSNCRYPSRSLLRSLFYFKDARG